MGAGGVKEKRRCNYHKHSLRDQLHFKETWALVPCSTQPRVSEHVRVGKHEQITRLLIAARSEEVSTLRLPARLETLRQAPAWKEWLFPCTFSYFMYKCVRSGALSQQLFLLLFQSVHSCALNQQLPCKNKMHCSIVLSQKSKTAAVRILCSRYSGDTAVVDNIASHCAAVSYHSAHFETYCKELSCSSVRLSL